MSPAHQQIVAECFDFLLEPELMHEIFDIGIVKELQSNEVLMEPGQYIKSIPLLLQGVLKVSRINTDGHEIAMYYLERGDTCSISLNCCIGDQKSQIRAITETETSMLLIPVQLMDIWLSKYKSWRQFVINSQYNRMEELFEVVDNLAFNNLDERLWKYLNDQVKLKHSTSLQITHSEISNDLNTSRVVVSRLLKKFELDNKIHLSRNKIDVVKF